MKDKAGSPPQNNNFVYFFEGIALDEDLNLGELTLSSAEDLTRDNDNETNSVCSSLGTGFSSSAGKKLYLYVFLNICLNWWMSNQINSSYYSDFYKIHNNNILLYIGRGNIL